MEHTAAVRIEGYDPAALAGLADATVPFDDHLGLEWVLLSPDRAVARLDLQPFHLQPYGIVHGGVYTSLVEAVGSLAAAARVAGDGKHAVGVHNATSFLRPSTTGRLEAVATPVHVGRTQQLWLVEITRADGKLAARGELRVQVIDPR